MVSGTLHPHRHDRRGVRHDLHAARTPRPTLVVTGKTSSTGSAERQRHRPAGLLPQVRALPERARPRRRRSSTSPATGHREADRPRRRGRSAGRQPELRLRHRPRRSPLQPARRSTRARWAAGPGEVVIDAGTAADARLRRRRHGRRRRATARCARFTRHRHRQLRRRRLARRRDDRGLRRADARSGARQDRLRRDLGRREARRLARRSCVAAIQRAPAADAPRCRPATEQAADATRRASTSSSTFIRGFLLAFGGIALFVGAFVIFNTLSITVAQRTRELATLRTLGASRRQVLRSVIAEAAVIGVVALAGRARPRLGLAKGLTALFGALGLDLPQADAVFETRTVVVALLVGASSPCWPASSRRSGRRACRRSPPCARARRSRGRVARSRAVVARWHRSPPRPRCSAHGLARRRRSAPAERLLVLARRHARCSSSASRWSRRGSSRPLAALVGLAGRAGWAAPPARWPARTRSATRPARRRPRPR